MKFTIVEETIIIDKYRGEHHGQTDGTLYIGNKETDEIYGYLDYSIYDGKVYIDMIEVKSEHRRKGYATQLFQELKRLHPDMKIMHGMSTPDGTAWGKSLK